MNTKKLTDTEVKAKRAEGEALSALIASIPESERENLKNIILGYKLGIEAKHYAEHTA